MTETKLLRTLDVCMPLLFIAALGARMTGVAAHELIGAILCVFFSLTVITTDLGIK